MLTENDVVRILGNYLKAEGYEIIQSLTTSEKGFDIVAKINGVTLYIEAKGETSSKENTKRYGQPFSKNQVKTHVAVAILASMKVLSKVDHKPKEVAIALPNNENHRDLIESIKPTIKKAGIKVFLVGKNSVAKIE